MGRPVELIPLNCPDCGTPVPAEPDEVAWVCAQCGRGMVLSLQNGLVPQDVNYSAAVPANGRGKPYWVVEGQVTLTRNSYDVLGGSNKDAVAYWSKPRRFFIPAYNCKLEEMLSNGIRLLAEQPELPNGARCAFEPATLLQEDIRSFAEFLVMAVEASRKDKLKEVEIQLELSAPSLWILPEN